MSTIDYINKEYSLNKEIAEQIVAESVSLFKYYYKETYNENVPLIEENNFIYEIISMTCNELSKQSITKQSKFLTKFFNSWFDNIDKTNNGIIHSCPIYKEFILIEFADEERKLIGPKRLEGFLKCPKCKSMKTESIGRQIRSADEGLTYFNVCFNCGTNWRVNG